MKSRSNGFFFLLGITPTNEDDDDSWRGEAEPVDEHEHRRTASTTWKWRCLKEEGGHIFFVSQTKLQNSKQKKEKKKSGCGNLDVDPPASLRP